MNKQANNRHAAGEPQANSPQSGGNPVASCHCGAVAITLPHAPSVVVECNCSLCRRYGVLWVYYDAGELSGLKKMPVNQAIQIELALVDPGKAAVNYQMQLLNNQ